MSRLTKKASREQYRRAIARLSDAAFLREWREATGRRAFIIALKARRAALATKEDEG